MPECSPSTSAERGLIPRELAKLYRVSPDRIRSWIASGELQAINTASARCGRPRFVILPPHLAEFEASRQAATPVKPAPRRKRQRGQIDYFPD